MKKLIITGLAVLVLSGCKTTGPQYHYGQYTSTVYHYFKADQSTLEEQISALEEAVQTAEAKSKPIAPGIHAHLGMLYFEAGNNDLGEAHFNKEKTLFPESTKYLDFLLSSAKEA